MRYVLEGEWTGYTWKQRRVVHREVIKQEWLKRQLENLHCIVYTDGTSLILHLREAKPREKVKEIHSYKSLIRDAARYGGSRVLVEDLVKAEKERDAAALRLSTPEQ